nr:unnamed protein product [Digitaria exilis]
MNLASKKPRTGRAAPRHVVVVARWVGPRRHEPLGDAVARVDLLPAAVVSGRRKRNRHGPVVVAVVLVAAVPGGLDDAAAPEVEAVAQGGRHRVRAAGVAHSGEQLVGGGRLGRRRRMLQRGGRGGGEDEQRRHEEEAQATAP